MIYADYNEDSNLELPDEFESQDLPVGDFSVEGGDQAFLIERKEWADLANSIQSGHMFNQLRRMKDHKKKSEEDDDKNWKLILLVEGNRSDAYTYGPARRGELRRFFSTIYAKFPGIYLIMTSDVNDTLNFVSDLDEWIHDDGGSKAHSVREAKKVPEGDRPQYVVEGLPGVGPQRALDLLDEFGSAKRVLNAETEELQEVDGVGPKTAEKIHDAATREI